MAKRTDRNHSRIRDILRSYGLKVFDTHALPNFVDLVVKVGDKCLLVEIKDGDAPLTDSQVKLQQDFVDAMRVIRNDEEAHELAREAAAAIEQAPN